MATWRRIVCNAAMSKAWWWSSDVVAEETRWLEAWRLEHKSGNDERGLPFIVSIMPIRYQIRPHLSS